MPDTIRTEKVETLTALRLYTYIIIGTESLLNFENEALEVFAFGMVNVDGVVSGLMKLMEYADVAPGLGSGSENGEAELLGTDGLGAAEREDYAARTDLAESERVKAGISTQGAAQHVTVLGKSRRVKDDEVVVARSHVVEVTEGIVGKSLVTFSYGRRKVEGDVGTRQVDGLVTAVYGMNELGTATQGVDGERTGCNSTC